MPDKIEEIIEGQYYHIYNRGINSCNLFKEEGDYLHFLTLYKKFIDPVAITYAWVLMPNHFHFLVYVKEGLVYKYSKEDLINLSASTDLTAFNKLDKLDKLDFNKWETVPVPQPDSVNNITALKESERNKIPNPTKHFSHLFNSYSKYYNAKYSRHGALFERRFKRNLIDTEDYLMKCIVYIHNNPVHHKFVSHPLEYSWSSYFDYLTEENETMKECVKHYFGDITNFKNYHKKINNDFEWD